VPNFDWALEDHKSGTSSHQGDEPLADHKMGTAEDHKMGTSTEARGPKWGPKPTYFPVYVPGSKCG